jgi:alkyl hydroperoxide reductase subunit AhpC
LLRPRLLLETESKGSDDREPNDRLVKKQTLMTDSQAAEQKQEEEMQEEETDMEAEPVPVEYDCPCHYCDDDSEIPARIGMPAPNFSVEALQPSQDISRIELSSYRERWLVLVTFPNLSTTITPSEIVAFSEASGRFADANCEILGLSLENVFAFTAWVGIPRAEGGLGTISFPLGSDLGLDIQRRYGLIDEDCVPMRATVIIDPELIIRYIGVNEEKVSRSVEETLRLVKAFQWAAEHGEKCPAQWKEGEPAIVPDVQDAKRYFGAKY